MTVTDNDLFDIAIGEGMSWCFWQDLNTSNSNFDTPISKFDSSSDGWVIDTGDGTNDERAGWFLADSDDASTGQRTSNDEYTNNTWNHFCLTFEDDAGLGGMLIYLNGVTASGYGNENIPNDVGNMVTAQDMVFGALSDDKTRAIDGQLSHIQFWTIPLGANLITQTLYLPGSLVGSMEGWWPLFGNDSPEVDWSGNGNTAALTNTTESSNGPGYSMGSALPL